MCSINGEKRKVSGEWDWSDPENSGAQNVSGTVSPRQAVSQSEFFGSCFWLFVKSEVKKQIGRRLHCLLSCDPPFLMRSCWSWCSQLFVQLFKASVKAKTLWKSHLRLNFNGLHPLVLCRFYSPTARIHIQWLLDTRPFLNTLLAEFMWRRIT